MDNAIAQCIRTRADFFEQYYIVPEAVRPELEAFFRQLEQLGEVSVDAVDFEARFAAAGLQEQMNQLLVHCTPKPYQMSRQDKQTVQETKKQLFREDRSRILKEAAQDALDHASVAAEEELIARRREMMIDAGVFDEHTRASNAVDMAKEVGGMLKGLFKKKK